jgi:hypothetical protein
MRYDNGRLMKHPRAANFAWRCENGKYLYWFHNHGGRFIREHPRRRSIAYEDRNPVWLAGGVEADSPRGKIIRWSQPEIVLYDDDPLIRMSYPDLVEEEGHYYLTETQKDIARVHRIDAGLLRGLWDPFSSREVSRDGLILDLSGTLPSAVPAPELPAFHERSRRADHGKQDLRTGFTLSIWIRLDSLAPGQLLLDNRTPEGRGFALQTANQGAVELILNDGRTESRWTSDPGVLAAGRLDHVTAVVDGGPKIISFVTNGSLNDGGEHRQFGWGRFSPDLRGVAGAPELRLGRGIQVLRIYNRALRVSEAIAAYRAGP